jgi:hypothetical protein
LRARRQRVAGIRQRLFMDVHDGIDDAAPDGARAERGHRSREGAQFVPLDLEAESLDCRSEVDRDRLRQLGLLRVAGRTIA